MKKIKRLYIAEWKTDANYTPNVHHQENIRAYSLAEAHMAADMLIQSTFLSQYKILEFRIWEIGKLVYEK